MPISSETTLRVVLYEGAEKLSAEERSKFVSQFLEKGYSVTLTNQEVTLDPGPRKAVVVFGRFGEARPLPSGDERLRFVEINGTPIEGLVGKVETFREDAKAVQHGAWKPWFPVIDYDRCTNCMQCLSFCLFGVYGVDEERKIQVQNNDNCKTNCPACSRVCPEAAIMFPKYKAGPINGDVVSDADLQREKMKVDISALLGGDIYSMLRERSEKAKSRFSKERDSEKALKERQKCLVALQKLGDIPAEVLMSLPSPEEIQKRAQEAAERVKAATQ